MPPTDESSNQAADLERRLNRRIRCEERVKFDHPDKDGCGGVVKTLSQTGCLLMTIDRLALQSEILIYLTLAIGEESMECVVAGQVVNYDTSVARPLRGYGIAFLETNPEATKKAIKDLVEATPRTPPPVSAQSAAAPKPAAPKPAAPRSPAVTASHAPVEQYSGGSVTSSVSDVLASSKGLLFFFLAILICVGAFYAYPHFIASPMKAELSVYVPILKIRKEDQDIFLTVASSWLRSTPRPEQEQKILSLGRTMAQKNIPCAHILDEAGQEWSIVMVAVGGRNQAPAIRWFKK